MKVGLSMETRALYLFFMLDAKRNAELDIQMHKVPNLADISYFWGSDLYALEMLSRLVP